MKRGILNPVPTWRRFSRCAWVFIGLAPVVLVLAIAQPFRGGGTAAGGFEEPGVRVRIGTSEHGTLLGEQDADGVISYLSADLLRRFGLEEWEVDPEFRHDGFVFARLMYNSFRGRGFGRWGGGFDGRWTIDFPQADLNLSFRLQQLTTLRVKPAPVSLPISPGALAKYPFVYMVEPGRLFLSDEEALALRNYLLNGGFLMVDDFWGEVEWSNFYREFCKVFPELPPNLPQSTPGGETPMVKLRELEIDHPIFQCVFPLKEKPQMPSINHYLRTGLSYERSDATEVHYKGVFDAQERMMAIICHNTDLGDGWEREGVDNRYFERFSESQAYPMAINILVYAMTH